jgi:predicted metalloprotease with PDZ domain
MQYCEFSGTSISADAKAQLQAALPHVMIDVRGAARLGIAGLQAGGNGGAQVTEVQPGTAAAKAGIQPNDLITEISGVPVENFAALTAEIAKAKPGDSVKLKVLRQPPLQPIPAGNQPPVVPPPTPLELTVTFEPWNDTQAINPNTPSPLGGMPVGMPPGVIINRR